MKAMKKHLLLLLAATLAWCAAAQKRGPELHRLAQHQEGAPQPALVTCNGFSNVRVRTAPSVDAPQAQVEGAEGDSIPLLFFFGCPKPYVEQSDGWYKLGEERWVSGTVTHAVPCPPIDSSMIGMMFGRSYGCPGGKRSLAYRVCYIGDGLYVAEERDLVYNQYYVYLGSRRGNVLCFPACMWLDWIADVQTGLWYEPQASFAIEHLYESYDIYRASLLATYGDKEAIPLSDGTMGLDYAKLTDAQLLDLMKDADTLAAEDALYLTADLLDSAHLRQPVVPLRPDGTPDYDAMLLGRHRTSLQWISWTNFGTVFITKNPDGTYNVKGGQDGTECSNEQQGVDNGDFLSISGTLTVEDQNNLLFDGAIVTKVYHLAGGQPCRREGQFHFKSTQGRKYWRLQEMDNPCDPVTDYVDIYMPVLK